MRLLLVALLLLASPVTRAEPSAEPTELAQVNARLAELRQQALDADPELRAAHDALEAAIEDAARAADPAYDDKLARLGILGLDLARLEAATPADAAAIQRAREERRAIQEQLADAHARVMAEQPLAGRIAEGRSRLLGAMARLDPEVPAMLRKLETIVRAGS